MLEEAINQQKIRVSNKNVPCRFCGKPASFIARYLSPFEEDQEIFPESMGLYYCPHEDVGFAYPVPATADLKKYYSEIYRDGQRLCSEDPQKLYAVVTSTPLADSQFMYLSQFIDFDKIQTVIDMGCGYGMLLRKIYEHNSNIRLVGIELDQTVRPLLEAIGAEFVHASASERVDYICDNISNDTLLISSHTLHYQNDFTFLRDIIYKTKRSSQKDVYLFVEVPNEMINNPAYVNNRVYDVPKLLFFTLGALQKNIFDITMINVSTNGWPFENEFLFRRKRLEEYRKNRKHRGVSKFLNFLKFLVPIRTRMFIKATLFRNSSAVNIIPYYSYGGDRRAIRMIGRVG